MGEIIQVIKDTKTNFRDLLVQIDKDIALAGVDAKNFQSIVSEELFVKNFYEFVEQLITYYPDDFNNFMYRVDVPESALKIIELSEMTQLVEQLCYLIIKREIQKLVYRKQFGS